MSVREPSLALGAAFSLSEPGSGEGASRLGGGGVAGSPEPENSGSKRVRRLSRGRFICFVFWGMSRRRLFELGKRRAKTNPSSRDRFSRVGAGHGRA